MNDILTLVQAVVGIFLVLFNIAYVLKLKRYFDDKIDDIAARAMTFYAKEKTDIVTNLPQLAEKALEPLTSKMVSGAMSNLGQLSGLSRSMKAMEKEMIADGIEAAGIPGGPMIAKYIQKYPFLGQAIPYFASLMSKGNNGQGQGQPSTSQEPGKW